MKVVSGETIDNNQGIFWQDHDTHWKECTRGTKKMGRVFWRKQRNRPYYPFSKIRARQMEVPKNVIREQCLDATASFH